MRCHEVVGNETSAEQQEAYDSRFGLVEELTGEARWHRNIVEQEHKYLNQFVPQREPSLPAHRVFLDRQTQ